MAGNNGLRRVSGPIVDPGPGVISQGPDPLWDCSRTIDDNRRRDFGPYFIYEIIELILALVEAYGVISGNKSDSTKMLSDMNEKLDEIKSQLSVVNEKMDTIVVMLRALPLIIRGEVEEVQMRQLLGQARAKVGQIQDKLRYVDQNVEALRVDADRLDELLGGVVGIKGLAGTVIVAPYMTVWLTAMVAVEKARKRANPSWQIDSPWQRDFPKRTLQSLQGLLDAVNAQDRAYWKMETDFPNHTDSYDLVENKFVKNTTVISPPPNQPPQPPQQYGEYKFACPTPSHPEYILRKEQNSATYKPVFDGTGYDAFRELLRVRDGMKLFYDMVPAIWQARDNITGAFVEPAGMWDVND